MTKILVLGSTGNIGWPLVQTLAQTPGVTVVAGIHRHVPEEMQALAVATVPFDFLQPETFAPALAGVDKIFFVRPPQLADPAHDMRPFLQAAKAHAVKQVVFVSLMGVEHNPMVPHRKIEQLTLALKLPHTFLRPSFFMQNLTTTHGDDLFTRHDLYIPAGRARTSFIDCRDIASAAAVCLTSDQYLDQALTLTGPEALTYAQVAAQLTLVSGVPVTYSHPGLLRFRLTMRQRGIAPAFVNVMVMLYVITRLGNAKAVTPTLAAVLGHPGRRFSDFARDECAAKLAGRAQD